MTDNQTVMVSTGQLPDGTLTLVVDGEAHHPDDVLGFTAGTIATLMHHAAQHAAQSAAGQGMRVGARSGLRAGRAISVLDGLVKLAELDRQAPKSDDTA